MLNVPAFLEEKNQLFGEGLIILLEIEYATNQFIRFARYNTAINFEGFNWIPFPISDVEPTETTQGELPAYDIALSNVGREIQSILEFNEIEGASGRLVWVHPDHLADDTAKIEEPFVIISATANVSTAVLTVAPVNFDPFEVQIPAEIVTTSKFPGVLGNRGRFLL